MKSLLLATFVQKKNHVKAIEEIKNNVNDAKVYVFKDMSNENRTILTYNSENCCYFKLKECSLLKNTIPIHRKRDTNTLFTLNALNEVIKDIDHEVDKIDYESVYVDWTDYRNSLVLTDSSNNINVVPLKLLKVL